MRANILSIAAAVVAITLLTACNVTDPIYNTSHSGQAQITVTTDWSGIGTGIVKPAEYYAAYASNELKATQDQYTFPNLFAPGSYTILFYNKPAGITISQTFAMANYAAPIGWLFTARMQETVEADKDYAFTVQMQQQVRQLTLVIEPMGGSKDKIESITAVLSGVADIYDMESDTHGTSSIAHGSPSNIALTFSKITSGADAGKWSATVRLLGVAGAAQSLTGTITFTGGTPVDLALKSDLTTSLAQFNNDKKTPLSLGGTVVETPTGAGFTATINDWTKVTGIPGTAN